MANPYYIPQGRNPGFDIANVATRLMGLKQQGQQLSIDERKMAETERVGKIEYGTEDKPGLATRRVEAAEQTVQTRRDELPWHLRPVNQQKWNMKKAQLKNAGLDKAMQPIFAIADAAQEGKANRSDLYSAFKSSPLAFMEVSQNLQKELESAIKKGDPVKIAQVQEMQGMTSDMNTFLDRTLPGVRQELEGKPPTPERLYETTEGWKPRSEAIGVLKPETSKVTEAKNYLLNDGTIVRSFDGGRSFEDESGQNIAMPSDAVKISATITGEELNMIRAKQQAASGTDQTVPVTSGEDIRAVGESGTGPYSMLAAAIDRFAGGVGADLLFGKKGFFPDTQANRQKLRTIKQVGKAALMNSSRGAIWEQEKIDNLFPDPDKLFTNPRTEANKFNVLRDTLLIEKHFNNQSILSATIPEEINDLRKSNIEIDRLLSLIGPKSESSLSPDDEALINKYIGN